MANSFVGWTIAKAKTIKMWLGIIFSTVGVAMLFSVAVLIACEYTGLGFWEQIANWATTIWNGIKTLFVKE